MLAPLIGDAKDVFHFVYIMCICEYHDGEERTAGGRAYESTKWCEYR